MSVFEFRIPHFRSRYGAHVLHAWPKPSRLSVPVVPLVHVADRFVRLSADQTCDRSRTKARIFLHDTSRCDIGRRAYPALPFGAYDRRSDGSDIALRHETAPKPVEVLCAPGRNLLRDQASSMCGRPVTTYPEDALSSIQEARIVLVSGELMIVLRKSSCEQAFVGNCRILPSNQERRYQVCR